MNEARWNNNEERFPQTCPLRVLHRKPFLRHARASSVCDTCYSCSNINISSFDFKQIPRFKHAILDRKLLQDISYLLITAEQPTLIIYHARRTDAPAAASQQLQGNAARVQARPRQAGGRNPQCNASANARHYYSLSLGRGACFQGCYRYM
jgi:hypothetical protein